MDEQNKRDEKKERLKGITGGRFGNGRFSFGNSDVSFVSCIIVESSLHLLHLHSLFPHVTSQSLTGVIARKRRRRHRSTLAGAPRVGGNTTSLRRAAVASSSSSSSNSWSDYSESIPSRKKKSSRRKKSKKERKRSRNDPTPEKNGRVSRVALLADPGLPSKDALLEDLESNNLSISNNAGATERQDEDNLFDRDEAAAALLGMH